MIDDKKKILIFNEIRESIIVLYEKIKVKLSAELADGAEMRRR
jgi:hypothetical protein